MTLSVIRRGGRCSLSAIAIVWACIGFAEASEDGPAGPLPPAQSAASFRFADHNLTVELVAAEPDIVSPVSIAWDEHGVMFVAEMIDYPLGPGSGRIRRLSDRDTKGRYKVSTVFADGLSFPNSVLPWNGGLLVSAAPNILFLKDTDGDNVADEKRVMLTGFVEGNQQLRVNALQWGLDGWVYGANGRSGGQLSKPGAAADQAVSIQGRDFRFRPETGEVEAIAGFSQFGLAHDDYGHRFTSWNTMPVRHVVLEESALRRNPWLVTGPLVHDVIPAGDWNVYPISQPPRRFNRETVRQYNATCGTAIYRGPDLGPRYAGNVFVAEPLSNLVHRRVLEPDGATFLAKRGEDRTEFLAASDPWFHPVNFATGPDGCLYIADFYREFVEHPDFVPADQRGNIDWRRGSEHGRIWRLRRKETSLPAVVTLDRKNTASLVEALRSPNAWVRETAQRILLEAKDPAAIPALRQLARSTVNEGPTPLHALWVLQQLGELDDPTLYVALNAANSRLVEAALKLCESRPFSNGVHQAVTDAIVQATAASRPNKAILRQAAVVLGNDPSPNRVIDLARCALAAGTDPWVMLAVLGGLRETVAPFLGALTVNEPKWLENPDRREFAHRLGMLVGSRDNDSDAAAAWNSLGKESTSQTTAGLLAFLSGYAEGLRRRGATLADVIESPQKELEGTAPRLKQLVDASEAVLDSSTATVAEQATSLRLLAEARPNAAAARIDALLNTESTNPLQTTAADLIGRLNRPDVAEQALAGWGRLAVGVRSVLLAAMSQSPQLAAVLVDAIEREVVRPGELDPTLRDSLRQLRDDELQKRFAAVLGTVDADRAAVVQRYRGEIGPQGDAAKGAALFAKNCLNCHQLQAKGFAVGPNLGSVAGRAREALVDDILNPSREVSPDFRNFVVVTHAGRVTNGLFISDTALGVTLRNPGGTETTTPRSEIEAFYATDKSLMPEGLESHVSPAELSDLIEFLQRGGTEPLP